MWMIICIIVAVILLGWIGIGYVGFKTAICRGHELDINDREALKGTAWDQYYDEIQEGIVWISQQETEDIYIQSEDGLKLHARLMDQSGAKGTVLMFHGFLHLLMCIMNVETELYILTNVLPVKVKENTLDLVCWKAGTAVSGHSISRIVSEPIRRLYWQDCPWELLRC